MVVGVNLNLGVGPSELCWHRMFVFQFVQFVVRRVVQDAFLEVCDIVAILVGGKIVNVASVYGGRQHHLVIGW